MSEVKIDNRRDILLMLLYSPGYTGVINEPVLGKTRLVKMLFLFKEEALKHFKKGTSINDENFYEFFPWNFGPFSRDVYDDVTFFILRDFIEAKVTDGDVIEESAEEYDYWVAMTGINYDDQPIEYTEEEFYLTQKGITISETLYNTLNNNQKDVLKEFKSKLNKSSLRTILRYVYTQYPSQITKSKIKDDVLRDTR